MRNLLFVLSLLISQCCLAQQSPLEGSWKIDLRPSPDAEPYYQTFEITEVTKTGIEGSFYGSSLEDTFINEEWERLYFGFTTKDQSSSYFHSGYLLDGEIYGITYCPDRGFIQPWTGEKK